MARINTINGEGMTPEAVRAETEYLLNYGESMQRELDAHKRPEVFTIGNDTYISTGERYQIVKPSLPDKIVRPQTFETFSLDGLISYIQEDVDGFFKEAEFKYLVRVSSPTHVEVISPVVGYWKERVTVAECNAVVPKIDFGLWKDPESFQIMLQTCFEESDNRAKVLQLSGSLRKEQSLQTADDGVSQRVTVNAGVATAADVTVKNPVYLTPYRTFREVDQPESPFIIRFNEDAKVALFTGDGSMWKLEAVALVAEYLSSNLAGYNVKVIA